MQIVNDLKVVYFIWLFNKPGARGFSQPLVNSGSQNCGNSTTVRCVLAGLAGDAVYVYV